MPSMDFCRFSPHWGMQSIPNFSGDLLHLTYWGSFKYSSPVHWVRKPGFNLLSLMNIRVWTVYAEFPPAYICVCHRFQDESSLFSQHFTVTLSSVAISHIRQRPHWSLWRADIYTWRGKRCFPQEWGLWTGFSVPLTQGCCNMCSLSSVRVLAHWVCPGKASLVLVVGKVLQLLCWFSPLLRKSQSGILKTQLSAWPFFLF